MGVLTAQPSIVDSSQPFLGPVVFDTVGNSYGISGPITPGAYQTQNGGGTCLIGGGFFSAPGPCGDAYVGKADRTGQIVFGTYLGGAKQDQTSSVAVDLSGNVFVGGFTGGSFPVTSGSAITSLPNPSTFAAKISADGMQLLYATYLPSSATAVRAMTVDREGNLYVAGESSSTGFVFKINAAGSAILSQQALPGPATTIAMDGQGNLVIAGYAGPDNFADLYLAKLTPDGTLAFVRTLGGSLDDRPSSVQIDSSGEIYVAGSTSSLDLPTAPGVLPSRPLVPLSNSSGPGGFLTKLSPDGSVIRWTLYVPTTDRFRPGVTQMAVTANGNVYIAGIAGAGFPVTGTAPKPCFAGGIQLTAGFAARVSAQGLIQDATYIGESVDSVYGIKVETTGELRVVSHSAGENEPGRSNTTSLVQFGSGASPTCLSQSVLNAATFTGDKTISPGEMISLTGVGIGPEVGAQYQPDSQGRVPVLTGDVQVLLNDTSVPVLYAQSRQVNAIIPMDSPFWVTGPRTNSTLKLLFHGTVIGSIDVLVAFGTPGIFRLDPGHSTQAAAMNQDGSVNGPDHPAPKGSVVALWGTGFGPGSPACTAGDLNVPRPTGPLPSMSAYVTSGVNFPATYIGSAIGLLCGVTQINVRVPSNAPSGTNLIRAVSEAVQDGSMTTLFGGPSGSIVVE